MKDKDFGVVVHIAFWFFKNNLLFFEEFIEDLIFDIAKTIKGNLAAASFLGNDQRSYDYLVEVEVLTKVSHIVASLQQVTGRDLAKLVSRVVMVTVDGEDRQADVKIFIFKVGFELIPIHCHLESDLFVAENVLLEDVKTLEKTLFGWVNFIEKISTKQKEIDMLSLSVGDDLLKSLIRIVESDRMLLFVSEVHICGNQETNPAILHDEPLLL